MDWTPAVRASQKDHDRRCPTPRCDWQTCMDTIPVPEMARHMGLIKPPLSALAGQTRDAKFRAHDGRRDDLELMCACGCVRRNHSVDGRRCYRCGVVCQDAGGFRLAEVQL